MTRATFYATNSQNLDAVNILISTLKKYLADLENLIIEIKNLPRKIEVIEDKTRKFTPKDYSKKSL